MRYVTWILVALASWAVFSGCGQQQRPGFPAQSYDEKKLIEDLETKFDLPSKIRQYYDEKPVLTQRELQIRRDEIITSRVTLINLHYNQFVADASFRRQMMDFGADIADLGVDLATAVVGSAATKSILGAISAGITGSQASMHKNFYFEKTVSAIVATMNANRKQALIPILTGQQRGVDVYPLGQALSDLDNYYFAETFLGALNAILVEAGDNEQAADDRIEEIRTVDFASSKWGDSIRVFWKPVNATHQKALLDWIAASNIAGSAIATLINSPGTNFQTARQTIVSDPPAGLGIPIPDGVSALPADLQRRVAIEQHWKPEDTGAGDQIEQWLVDNDLNGLSIELFISAADFGKKRIQMVKDLNIPIVVGND